jgi:endonuclease/exonuclease/phosphatase family metal-dependent hydrolase
VRNDALPGRFKGRGLVLAEFPVAGTTLAVAIAHLALGRKARWQQLAHIASVLNPFEHVVVMGDLNCVEGSDELRWFRDRCNLVAAGDGLATYPSWAPSRRLDHILVSSDLKVRSATTLHRGYSDHRPVVVEIEVPAHSARKGDLLVASA